MIVDFFSLLAGFIYFVLKGLWMQATRSVRSKQYRLCHYNFARQAELEYMVFHDYQTVAKLAGKDFSVKNDREIDDALCIISDKEGWVFYTIR